MKNNFDLEQYLSGSVENIVKSMMRLSAFSPKESVFMAHFAASAKKAAMRRHENEAEGLHIPPFLIASITGRCNLHCKGCYARSVGTCSDGALDAPMSADEWENMFRQASELGISFIMLAGGEPLLRRDVLERAALFPEILFPVITNGTLLQDEYLPFVDKHRNIVPILSIEGGQETTDSRRGKGVYQTLQEVISAMKKKKIAFGASMTVTTENLAEITEEAFVCKMRSDGAKALFYIEFVPTAETLIYLAPGERERQEMEERLGRIRSDIDDMVILSFPGDEKHAGGCLAAGRGFFHINPSGGAEPCPFSPYSDVSVKEKPLGEVLRSPLFGRLQASDLLKKEHTGGCVLFGKDEEVKALL